MNGKPRRQPSAATSGQGASEPELRRGSAAEEATDRERNDAPPDAAQSDNLPERVGYGRPPIATRFRPGQSGNPRGRPKGARNLNTIIASALSERVAVNENGKRRRLSKMEAVVKQLVNRAASGEARATQLLLALVQAQEAQSPAAPESEKFSKDDAFVMAELTRRIMGSGK